MDDNKYYELHVTVSPENVLHFRNFCTNLNIKCLHIKLDHGQFDEQLMLAMTTSLPNDTHALIWAEEVTGVVSQQGFAVVRTKLESRLVEGPNTYYEAHWKLDYGVDPEYWRGEMVKFLSRHPELLLSYNLADPRIHYLSQRIYDTDDYLAASTDFNTSGVKINFGGLPLIKVHYERCVYDSNPALDSGWAAK